MNKIKLTWPQLQPYAKIAAGIAVLLGSGALVVKLLSPSGEQVSAQQFVNLQQGAATHAGFRRAHAKGFCIAGSFQNYGSLAPFSSAQIWQQPETSFIGRISIAGNNPTAPDLKAPVRSLALSFGDDSNQTWRLAMNTPPVMAVATPAAFYQQLQTLAPDPATGQPNRERIQAFFAAHPETAAFTEWRANYQPSASFATELYHSINAFYLVDNSARQQAVRWTMVPTSTPSFELPTTTDPDALQKEFSERLALGPVLFDWVFTLANAEDDENDPTQPWPADREQIVAGQISIERMTAQVDGACNAINFDPLVLPAGLAATADPILRARSSAYAESYKRRAQEHAFGQAGANQ